MGTACIRLLGLVEVEQAGTLLHGFESRKSLALLCYLIARGKPVSREFLIDLFWGEKSEKRGRGNLSRVLNNLNQLLPGLIQADRYTIQFVQRSEDWVDLYRFQDLVGKGDPDSLSEAVRLWRGEFMEGNYLDGCPEAETWMVTEREHWRHQYTLALEALVAHHLSRGEFSQALAYVSTQLELDPWREEVHCQRMELLARTGQRSAALKQYELCRKMLLEELGVEPGYETRLLYNRIRVVGERPRLFLPPLEHLPQILGREDELAEVSRLLASPGCRLLTITGPGGVGKSRLALQTAWQLRDAYLDGVALIALAAAHSPEQTAESIAQGLGFSYQGRANLKDQLSAFLAEKEILLVLDNFEHLLHLNSTQPDIQSQGALLLAAGLLEHASHLKIMVTSRERLNLKDEWVFMLNGLAYDLQETGSLERLPPAIELFVQRARQISPGFEIRPEDRPDLARVCAHLEGNPLGIELAAVLTGRLSCRELTTQMSLDLDALDSTFIDRPDRHRGLRSVFDQSWGMLSETEQALFQQLAVFDGGFRAEACEAVAQQADAGLAGLEAKSLLKRNPSGLYEIHEILKQYAFQKLGQQPGKEASARDRHCRYYLAFLQQLEPLFSKGDHKRALQLAGEEIANIRSAWAWAVDRNWLELIDRGMDSLFQFYDLRGWLQEGLDMFQKAIARAGALPQDPNLAIQRTLAR
ncbi:MAG: hypothetical protein EHM70_15150, partial [Chloroflexota bacterium]